MKRLLDTRAPRWWSADPARIAAPARELRNRRTLVDVAPTWEIEVERASARAQRAARS